MKKRDQTWKWALVVALLHTLPLPLLAQDTEEDERYWQQDTVLVARIDTLGIETVLAEIRNGIQRALTHCAKENAFLQADSVEAWIEWMRWAVILEDSQGLDLINALIPLTNSSDHGNWQYHFSYMTMWAAYEAQAKQNTPEESADFILSHLNKGNAIENVFYEERMMDLGTDGIPLVIAWTKTHLIPRMHELDREMLSEEDLLFPRLYNRFVIIFSTMMNSEEALQMIRSLLSDADQNVQRFGRDVLDASGY